LRGKGKAENGRHGRRKIGMGREASIKILGDRLCVGHISDERRTPGTAKKTLLVIKFSSGEVMHCPASYLEAIRNQVRGWVFTTLQIVEIDRHFKQLPSSDHPEDLIMTIISCSLILVRKLVL
jgi:hypothetical protein